MLGLVVPAGFRWPGASAPEGRDPNSYLPVLDMVRGVAALAVVVCHAIAQTYPDIDEVALAELAPLEEWLVVEAREFGDWLGTWGVGLFFVLSGFCIHLKQARRLVVDPIARLDWRDFLRRRAWRLLPTHYASLALACAVGLFIETNLIHRATFPMLLAHIGMIHVWVPGGYFSINVVFWSIAVEVNFYLVYPVYLRLHRRLEPFVLTGLILALGLAIHYLGTLVEGDWRHIVEQLFLTKWWQWALGAALADLFVRRSPSWWRIPFSLPYGALIFGVASLALAFVDPVLFHLHVRLWLVPLLCGLLLGTLVLRHGTLNWRWLEGLGVMSYSLYLVHPVALALVLPFARWLPTPLQVLLECAAGVVFARYFFALVERHFLNVPGKVRPTASHRERVSER